MNPAKELAEAAIKRGKTIATAESLTAGLVAATIAEIPGVSACLRGGIVSYSTDLKSEILGVDSDLLDRNGAVDPDVALQMAVGAAQVCQSDLGLSTTGVAGPDAQDGTPVGTVFIAVHNTATGETVVEQRSLSGDRNAIRTQTVEAVCMLAHRVLTESGESIQPSA